MVRRQLLAVAMAMAVVGAVLAVLCAGALGGRGAVVAALEMESAGGAVSLSVSEEDGAYSLRLRGGGDGHGEQWTLRAGETAVQREGRWHSSSSSSSSSSAASSAASATLRLLETEESRGVDGNGAFQRTTQRWEGGWETSFRLYDGDCHGGDDGSNLLVFSQRFVEGVEGSNVSDASSVGQDWGGRGVEGFAGDVETSFPSFVLPEKAGDAPTDTRSGVTTGGGDNADAALRVAYATLWGNMGCPKGREFCARVGGWDATSIREGNYDGQFPGGVPGGFPLVLFSEEMQSTVLISSWVSHMAASVALKEADDTLAMGVMGGVLSIPQGYVLETALIFVPDGGVNDAFEAFKSHLTRHTGVDRDRARQTPGDVTIDYVSVYTDNGAYYYYITDDEHGNTDYESTVKAIWDDATANDLPYRSFQLDSWFYYRDDEVEGGGTTQWDARPDIFPDGIANVQDYLNVPFTAHNRWWSPENIYAKQNGGDFEFVIDERTFVSLPMEQEFWEYLFAESRRWGLSVYEQDWLHTSMVHAPYLLESATLGTTWLTQMGNAANRFGIRLQYCMAYPRFILQASEVPSVSQARVSDDYGIFGGHEGVNDGIMNINNQWSVGDTSLLAHSVGIAPFKDVFWSSTVQPGSKYHRVEPYPDLHALVATLTTGPVATGDKIGHTDRDLLMRSCNDAGLILKPSRPATSLDATFLARAFPEDSTVRGRIAGSVTGTHAVVDGLYFPLLLAVTVENGVDVYPHDLPQAQLFAEQQKHMVAWSLPRGQWGLDAVTMQDFDASHPIHLHACDKSAFQYWRVSPVFEDGSVLLGEANKWVPVSAQRFRHISSSTSSTTLQLDGEPGELVSLSFVTPSGKLTSTTCRISERGRAAVVIPDGTCSM